MVVEPQGALRCMTFTLAWPILARFMDYYSLFWGPGAIFMVAEPQGALTYRSSTLTVLTILTCFIDYYSPCWGKEQFP